MDKNTIIEIASLFLGWELKGENVISWRFRDYRIEVKIIELNGRVYVYSFGLVAMQTSKDKSETNFDY